MSTSMAACVVCKLVSEDLCILLYIVGGDAEQDAVQPLEDGAVPGAAARAPGLSMYRGLLHQGHLLVTHLGPHLCRQQTAQALHGVLQPGIQVIREGFDKKGNKKVN